MIVYVEFLNSNPVAAWAADGCKANVMAATFGGYLTHEGPHRYTYGVYLGLQGATIS